MRNVRTCVGDRDPILEFKGIVAPVDVPATGHDREVGALIREARLHSGHGPVVRGVRVRRAVQARDIDDAGRLIRHRDDRRKQQRGLGTHGQRTDRPDSGRSVVRPGARKRGHPCWNPEFRRQLVRDLHAVRGIGANVAGGDRELDRLPGGRYRGIDRHLQCNVSRSAEPLGNECEDRDRGQHEHANEMQPHEDPSWLRSGPSGGRQRPFGLGPIMR